MPEDRPRSRSSNTGLAVVIERLDTFEEDTRATLKRIEGKVDKTNGRVTELEVKDRIRKDREEQKAIRDAASEAAKYRLEQHAWQETTQTAEHIRTRLTIRVMLVAAGIGAAPALMAELARWVFTGHP